MKNVYNINYRLKDLILISMLPWWSCILQMIIVLYALFYVYRFSDDRESRISLLCIVYLVFSLLPLMEYISKYAGQRSDSFHRCRKAGQRPFDQISEQIN